MDPATVIALCKENIQPLRYGRNAAQLGTALRAQEDAGAQQLLLQEKQMYEDAINNYEGDDPLENWYEYILWVEQSYPKSGHESHIGKLLQQCLSMFEKETKYHQDRRYIRLWINYINMQKNPLELYKLLHNNGIGTMVADLYRAWAFEFEQIEDYKHADEVYLMGLDALAEPRDELARDHNNFQLAVARKTLGRTEDFCELSIFEQRQAFSSLKAIKSGRKVSNLRTGHRVREHFPGTVPQVSGATHLSKSNSRIQIYQDDLPGELKGSSILDHVPVEDTVHKENTIKAGPWHSGAKRCPLLLSAVKTAFKVHEDQSDEHDMEKLRLFTNHVSFFDGSTYPEHLTVPVFVPDMPNPNITFVTHYPKKLVYNNNIDQSMEEIRSQYYLQRRAQRLENERELDHRLQENASQMQQENFQEHVDHLEMGREELQILETQRREAEQRELERLEAERLEAESIEAQRLEAERLEAQRLEAERIEAQRLEAERMEAQRREAERLEAQRREAERIEAQRLEAERIEAQRREAERLEAQRLEAERIEAQRIEAERLEAQRMEAELNSQRKLQTSNFMHQHHTSALSAEPEEHLLGQSLTVNTKEAISEIDDMWQSTGIVHNNPPFRPAITSRMPDTRSKLSFDIHMDSSMTQHAMSSSKHHSGYNVQPYNNQENHQSYSLSHQSYTSQDHHTPYRNSSLHNTYQYQMQPPHHEPQMQPELSRSHHSQHHQLLQTPQQGHHHQSLSHSPHLQAHTSLPHHQTHTHSQQHHTPHSQHLSHHPHQQHSTHQHMQHMQHSVYGNMLPNDLPYQQYPGSLESSMIQQNVDAQKHLHYQSYTDPEMDTSKPYRMPPELPFIKSPGTNRRDMKYLESTEDKENTIVVHYNGPNIDESLGITPLPSNNDSCYTEAFNTQLSSSTPMTNHYRQSYKMLEPPPYPNQCVTPQASQSTREVPNVDPQDKLSIILETTREYTSSSSNSSTHARTTGLGFTITREDLLPIKEQSIIQTGEEEPNDTLISSNQTYEQKLQAQIQAVHAQSPRTVQRNVDQITSDIKTNCDLRKSITFRLNEIENREKVDIMECEENEPMEESKEDDEETEEEAFQIPSGDINPFDKNLLAGLLKNLKFPQPHHADGYVRLNLNLNKIVPSTSITLGNDAYDLEKCLGKGMYGTVVKAVNLQTGQTVALKAQRPAWVWEYYITREIKARLTNPHMLRGFMDVSRAYIANNSSVLVSEYSKYGTLLAVTNQIKLATGRPLAENLAVFFTIEILQIVEYLHKCQIIHADIKPDNFLLMRMPTEDVRPTLQLIDFGCSIDMKLLPENTTFTQMIKTEDFTCIEMQTGRPWTYQTDLYCLAATSHCLLFGNYMRVVNTTGRWFISNKVPRYARKAAWEQFFTELLNIESCEKIPDLGKLRNMMEETLAQMSGNQVQMRHFVNILNKR